MKKLGFYFLPLFLLQACLCLAQEGSSFVFKNGEEGYACYRIPAIIQAPNGDLLAFAEGRKKECNDFGDIDLVMKRSTNGGGKWSPLAVVVDNGILKAGNPAPVVDFGDPLFPHGRILLLYNTATTSEGEARRGNGVREVLYKASSDNGKTWGEAVNITTSVHKPLAPSYNAAYQFKEDWRTNALTPGHAFQFRRGKYKGRIFVAANHSALDRETGSTGASKSHCFFSDDHGRTWQLGATIEMPGGNESTAAELSGGGVLQNVRYQSKEIKNRILAFSPSGGERWDTAYISQELPDPVCQGSMLSAQYRNRYLLLFSNAASREKREHMTITVSSDDGRTWSHSFLVDAGAAAYSDMVSGGRKKIVLIYEKGSDGGIVYVKLPLKKILKNSL